ATATVGDTTISQTAPVVAIQDGNDGVVDSEDLAEGQVQVSITVPSDAEEGDTLSVTNANGDALASYIIGTDANAGETITLAIDKPDDETTLTINAQLSDEAGNLGQTGTDSATIGDTTAPSAPTVTINDGGDGTIDTTDLNADGTVSVTITLPGDAQVRDIVTVNGVETLITQEMLNNGFTTSVTKPADGEEVSVTATVTDKAGNESAPDTATATVGDTTAP
ncbi:hypothetical protein, partial [Psychrobacter sanguinis]|uniref:hypothetical protein n=1 Tax=Psychrobacter sanguinis TaxID=861445 RepID=UPI00195D06B8